MEGRVAVEQRADAAPGVGLSEEALVARWRALYRDGTWITVVRDLERHLHRSVGADGYALWAQLPPGGQWLRIAWASTMLEPVCLPAETEPLATVRSTLQPCRCRLPDMSERYRLLMEKTDMSGAWVLPLSLPDQDGAPGQFIGAMSFGSRRAPTADPPGVDAQLSVIAYLLMQRVQEVTIDGLLTWMLSQTPPFAKAEWASMLKEICGWLGGDQWVLVRLPAEPAAAGAFDRMAEFGLWPDAGSRWLAQLRRDGAEGPGIGTRSLTQQRIEFVGDLLAEPDDTAARSSTWLAEHYGLRSAVALPLGVRGQGDVGLLLVFWREAEGWKAFTASARPWEALRRNLAVWWQEAANGRQLLTDPLTRVYNRRGIDRMWRGWSEEGGCVGILDCDGFHRINNRWGHLMGDEVLRIVGATLREESRRNGGWCGRWGGDEFVVVLPSEESWRGFGRRVSRALGMREREHHWPQHVSLSGGAVLWSGERPIWEHVLAVADGVLYRVKQGGGGRFLSRRYPVRR